MPAKILDDYKIYEETEMMAPIAIIMAALGLFTKYHRNRIGNRISFVLITMTNNNILPLLLLMATVCMFLGWSSTIPSYILVALIGPALANLGIPLILAHMFFIMQFM